MYTIHKKWEAIPYRPKFSSFDDIQLFQNKLFTFTKKLSHVACLTIFSQIFAAISFHEKCEIYSP